jgi:hypothetical protein
MGYPTKVQRINRQKSDQWYINLPAALARAMEFARSETVEWFVEDKETLVLHRPEAPQRKLKKTPYRPSPEKSGRSSNPAATPSDKSATGDGGNGSS